MEGQVERGGDGGDQRDCRPVEDEAGRQEDKEHIVRQTKLVRRFRGLREGVYSAYKFTKYIKYPEMFHGDFT